MSLPTSVLGRTGLSVTKLAYGAMELRAGFGSSRDVTDAEASVILNRVLDEGITLIDTSPDYGSSEEMIGKALAGRRHEYVLTSKCGCAVGSGPHEHVPATTPHDYSRANIRAGVEQSLARLRTDHIDVVQIHISPSRATLEAEDSLGELRDLQAEGKVRFIGMSGAPPHLADQIAMGVFDVFQISYSALERDNEAAISDAAAAGAGVIVRGGMARGMAGQGVEVVERQQPAGRAIFGKRRDLWFEAGLDKVLDGLSPQEFMLRFTISHPGMTTTIVGSTNLTHITDNVRAASNGPLPPDQVAAAKKLLDEALARRAAA